MAQQVAPSGHWKSPPGQMIFFTVGSDIEAVFLVHLPAWVSHEDPLGQQWMWSLQQTASTMGQQA